MIPRLMVLVLFHELSGASHSLSTDLAVSQTLVSTSWHQCLQWIPPEHRVRGKGAKAQANNSQGAADAFQWSSPSEQPSVPHSQVISCLFSRTCGTSLQQVAPCVRAVVAFVYTVIVMGSVGSDMLALSVCVTTRVQDPSIAVNLDEAPFIRKSQQRHHKYRLLHSYPINSLP